MFHPKANFWKFPLNLLIVEKDTPKTTGKNPIFRFDWAWDWNSAVYWQPQARQVNSFLLVTRVVFTVNMGTVTLPPVTLVMKQMTISTRTSDFHLLSRPIGFKFKKKYLIDRPTYWLLHFLEDMSTYRLMSKQVENVKILYFHRVKTLAVPVVGQILRIEWKCPANERKECNEYQVKDDRTIAALSLEDWRRLCGR